MERHYDQSKIRQTAVSHDLPPHSPYFCFKPLPFSKITSEQQKSIQDLEKMKQILEEISNFRAPEGLSDPVTFEHKQEYWDHDSYIRHYGKDHRDEAVNAHRSWTVERTGQPIAEVIHEPKNRKIKFRVLSNQSLFTRTMFFARVSCNSFMLTLRTQRQLDRPITRVEALV